MRHPLEKIVPMETATTLRFATAARDLAHVARANRLVVPGFRSPPRLTGADRTLRRRRGGATVAVRVRGRPWMAVLADMIEGVVAVNHLVGPEADRVRRQLWAAAGERPTSVAGEARVA
jgi:hypothetical protein